MENFDNKHNELDKFFQDKLGSNNLIDDSWNVPPIGVLNNALGVINLSKKKRRKRNLLFLLLLLSIGLTLLVIRNSVNLYRIQQKVDIISEEQSALNSNEKEILTSEKKKKIEPQKNKVIKKQQLNSTITNQAKHTIAEVSSNRNETEFKVDKTSKKEIQAIINKSASLKQNQSNESSNKQNQSTIISNKNKQKETISNSSKITNFEIKTSESIGLSFDLSIEPPQKLSIPESTKNLQIKITQELNLPSISLLPLIDNELENSDNLQLLSNQKHFLPTDIIDGNDTKFWMIYAFSGINFSKQRMTNLPSNPDFMLLEYDKSYVGLESGIGLQYHFSSKFNLNLTLGYSKINNESVYLDQTAYNPDNEIMDADGTVTYKSGYSVQTTALAYQDTFDFEVKDDNIKQMDNHTYIKQGCQNLRTSLALEYNIVSKNKFTIKLGAGAGANYLMKAAQHLNTNILYGNTSLYTSNDTLAATKNMNRLLLFGLGTASINYQITPKINLGFRNEYSIDLNSSRIINNTSDPKTFSQGFRTFLTAGYRF